MSQSANANNRHGRWLLVVWLAAYVATMCGVVALVLVMRRSTLREMGTPEAQAQWQQWRQSSPNQDTTGPVRRRPPPSVEPPALVLMRDYFTVVMSGALLFSSLLFAALMLAVRGVLAANVEPARRR